MSWSERLRRRSGARRHRDEDALSQTFDKSGMYAIFLLCEEEHVWSVIVSKGIALGLHAHGFDWKARNEVAQDKSICKLEVRAYKT